MRIFGLIATSRKPEQGPIRVLAPTVIGSGVMAEKLAAGSDINCPRTD
jgi:hypothetical protein